MPPASNARRSNVRRANVTACMRCKSRKQRCDQSIPACLNCEVAGVECVNVDINGQVTPRSYIRNLEDRVAYLEKQLISHGITDYDSPIGDESVSVVNAVANPAVATPLSPGRPANAATSPTSTQPLLTASIPAVLMSTLQQMATESVPVNSDGDYRGLLEGLPYDPQTALPSREVAHVLVDAYFEHSDFFSPILARRDLEEELDRTYNAGSHANGPSVVSPSSVPATFRITIVFAIAARLLHCKDSSFPTSRAEAYYASATRILSANTDLIQKSGLDQLEHLVLVIQYLFFSSNLGPAWYLLGFATRMALELGIHRESPGDSTVYADDQGIGISGVRNLPASVRPEISVNDDMSDRRRWIFWAIYSFERILCHVLSRPCSIPDEAITTSLPSATGDGDTIAARRVAIHFIKHRQLSSEIERTLTQGHSVNGAVLNYTAWRDGMWQRLQEWRASVPEYTRYSQLAPPEIFEGSFHNSMVRLYLPSSLMPEPNDFEYAFLARSAIQSVEMYKITFKEGKLRFYWRTLHHLFRAGVALVQCLKFIMSASALNGDLRPADLKSSINTCSAILWGMVERYHLGRAYRDTFEAISAPFLNETGTLALQAVQTPLNLFEDIYVSPGEFGLSGFI